jgi:hypothetical protein
MDKQQLRSRKPELTAVGDSLRWPRDTLYPLKLALTSPTNGGRSVGIVRLRTKAMEFVFCIFSRWVSKLRKDFLPPRQKYQNPSKSWNPPTNLYGIKSQKTLILIATWKSQISYRRNVAYMWLLKPGS